MPESEHRGPDGVGPDDPGLGPTQRQADLDRGETLRPARTPTAPADNLNQAETIRGRKPGDKVFNQRYELKRILGRGGMGVVWLAQDRELDHEVALKFLPEVMAYNEAAILELKRETKKALLLTHPHIVRIHGWERDAENAAVSMEYVDGRTLAALKAERETGCLEVADIREWVQQLCEALEYAHGKAKVVHRDLKPQNLMFNSKGDLKITDFGISRSLEESVSKTTRGGAGFSGTLSYMSPQQLGSKPSEPADDLYALGATIYELLTGKPPFYGGNIDRQIREETAPSMAQRRRELGVEGGQPIPEEWERVVAACLAKEPGQRPASAKAVWAGLEGNHQGTKDTKKEKAQGRDGTAGRPERGGAEAAKREGELAVGDPVQYPGVPGAGRLEAGDTAGWKPAVRKGKWLALAAILVLVAFGAWWWGPGKQGADASTAPRGPSNVAARPTVQVPMASTGQLAQALGKPDSGQASREVDAKAKTEQEAAARVQAQREAEERTKQEAAPQAASMTEVPKRGEAMTNSIGMELVWIAPGKFTMGSPASEAGRTDDEGPQTEVTLTKGYWLGKYEVTQVEYEAVMGSNPSNFKGARLPVETVSWTEAVEFCRKLTERERSGGKLPTGCEYRLPTEAQWEYACRAGTTTRFSSGDADSQLGNAGWYSGNSGNQTHPVGQKQPNAWGQYDMHGNVWEWCADWSGTYPGGSVTDPTGAGLGLFRVFRGGGWGIDVRCCRSAFRVWHGPGIRNNILGFRATLVAVSAPSEANRAEKPSKTDEHGTVAVPQPGRPYENSLGMKFLPVPGTQVLFSIWETRVKDYAAYAAANSGVDGSWKTPGFAQGDTHPVVKVSWDDAVAFCRWLTERERKTGLMGSGQEYRLPTDTEWSYAVGIGDREGESSPSDKDGKLEHVYPWGTNLNLARVEGNYGLFMGEGRFERTSPSGSFKANQYGLFDMGGNVWEWCQDWYDSEQKYRVLRGGSWSGGTKLSSHRYNGNPGRRSDDRGFRVVLAGGSAR